ncbi:MAG: hypothetical protein ACLFMW_04770 [Ectothiorhodospira sp.]
MSRQIQPTQAEADAASPRGQVWPSPGYHRLVEDLRRRIGEEIYLSIVSFNGAFRKEGQPYRLLDVIAYPRPRAHPHPPKRAYPHMLVLESVQPPGQDDLHWHSGLFHGGAINLAHVGSVSTRAYPQRAEEYLYANLDLLSAYYACPARQLLERQVVPARICVESTAGDRERLTAAQGQGEATET